MEYAAIAIAILGCAVGATFRLRFLLVIIVLVLAISVVFSLFHGSGPWDTSIDHRSSASPFSKPAIFWVWLAEAFFPSFSAN